MKRCGPSPPCTSGRWASTILDVSSLLRRCVFPFAPVGPHVRCAHMYAQWIDGTIGKVALGGPFPSVRSCSLCTPYQC